MNILQDIKNLITDCNIKLFHSPLPQNIKGTFYSDKSITMIVMNNSIDIDSATYKTVLLEELGHYFTSIGDNTPKKHMSYAEK